MNTPTPDQIREALDVLCGMTSLYSPGERERARATLESALAAAENRGFRAAVEWIAENFNGCDEVGDAVGEIRAEADRREGK